jgi:hypothetical protein
LNPRILDNDCRIAHSRDEVDKEIIAVRLKQPNWVANFALEAFVSKILEPQPRIRGRQKKIKVLGIAANACVLL